MFPCPNCNQQLSRGVQFCPNCGFRFNGGRLLTGVAWVDGFLGFLLFCIVPYLSFLVSRVSPSGGSLVGLLWFGLPLVLGIGFRYRSMVIGYLIGFGIVIALFLGLLALCAIGVSTSLVGK